MGLEVATGYRDDLVILTLTGELDIYTVQHFKTEVLCVDGDPRAFVLDLQSISLLDSSGLGAIVAFRSGHASGEGQVVIASTSRQVLRVFEVTGMKAIFPIHDDVEQAIRALTTATPEN